MAHLANFNGVCETLLTKPEPFNVKNARRWTIPVFASKKKEEEFQEAQVQANKSNCTSMRTTRRASVGLVAVTLSAQFSSGVALAEDNGLWLTGPLPVPTVFNKIANEETGTRSFLKKGIYMANIGPEGSAFRLRKYAFDLMGLGDLIGLDEWSYMRKYLRLKSTFMYYDFDKVISAAPVDEKQPLMDLANRLFNNVEKLEDAVKTHDLPQTKSCYEDTTALLHEVMKRMA
eukprot:TRINITY_DN25658_c0_g1_i1.p1 TRINITY_DN25658_c0_g1~~TRINITY_DN25658_c0_g1_i1.p1  ORF type:complete len:231 (-),score=30.78 TRINITY_DN25658_c0_g1_i1:164-856(-)